MDQLRLHLLGEIHIQLQGEALENQLPGKALALLVYLAVSGTAQTRDTLASLLWSDFPEHRARSNLRDTLALLRRTPLAPYLRIERRAIALNPEAPSWLDTAEFQQALNDGQDPSALEAAVALYQGEFLAGFNVPKAALFEEWVAVQRQNMHLSAVSALERLVDCYLDTGDHEAGIDHAQRLLALDPWREETHRNLMLLHLLNGDANTALKQYERCREILDEELGVAPSAETQTLYHNICKRLDGQTATDDLGSFSAPVPHAIPGQNTPIIGRDREQRAIDIVLGNQTGRLITIFGVGGIGKTRLALAIAERQLQTLDRSAEFRFPDGVYFAPLEAIETPDGIVPALCLALGFQPAEESRAGRSAEQQLLDYLRSKRLLLVIDNFEHLLDGVGLLARISHDAPGVHLLVTSRQKLNLHGERLYALEGLGFPRAGDGLDSATELLADYPAAALFVAAARRGNAAYQLQNEEVPTLAHLCRLVEGLPLAIELAAGWTSVLSLDAIVDEIVQGISFLESDLRDLPDRHHSMEAVFDVSWHRLPAAEQAVFTRLCVFRGGFTRQAAAHVAGASLRQLAALSNRALIQYDKRSDRYQIHRLLRQFGALKLAQDPTVEQAARDHHCTFYCAALGEWDKRLKGAGQVEALVELENEHANTRSAWHHAVKNGRLGDLESAADGLFRFYLWRRRFHEGEMAAGQAEEALSFFPLPAAAENAPGVKRLIARIQTWHSIFEESGKSDALINQALDVLNSPQLQTIDARRERAFALQRAGDLTFDSDNQEARRLYQQSLALYRELNDAWGTTKILTALGWLAAHYSEIEVAAQLGKEALALARARTDMKQTADALWLLGTAATITGKFEEAGHLIGESLDIRQMLGDNLIDIAAGTIDLGMTLTWIGRMEQADAVREEALSIYKAQGQPEQIALAHIRLANSKLHLGHIDATKHHARAALKLCREVGDQRSAGLAMWLLAWVSLLTGEIEQANSLMQESVDIFRAIGGAFELGWALGLHADIARKRGQPTLAKKFVHEALSTASGVLGHITLIIALTSYAMIMADEGRHERAAELAAQIEKYPIMMESRAASLAYLPSLADSKAALPPQIATQAQARGRARNIQEMAGEVIAELEADLKQQ